MKYSATTLFALYDYILREDVKKEVLAKGESTTAFNTQSMSKLESAIENNPHTCLTNAMHKIRTARRDGRYMYVGVTGRDDVRDEAWDLLTRAPWRVINNKTNKNLSVTDAKWEFDSGTYVLHVSCSKDLILNLEEYYINKFTDLYPDLLLNKGTTGVNKKIDKESTTARNETKVYRVYITFYEYMKPAVENGDITISFKSTTDHITNKIKKEIHKTFHESTTFREDNEEWRTTYKALKKYYNEELQNNTNGNRSVQQIYDAIFKAQPLYKAWVKRQLLSTNMIHHQLIVAIELHKWDFDHKEKLITELDEEPKMDYSGAPNSTSSMLKKVHTDTKNSFITELDEEPKMDCSGASISTSSMLEKVCTDTNNSLITILVKKKDIQRRQAEKDAIRARRVRQRGFEKKMWQHRYHELIEYKKLYHHTCVPVTYAKNPQLGRWVRKQRHQGTLWSNGTNCNLTIERIQLLNKIGFHWSYKSYASSNSA